MARKFKAVRTVKGRIVQTSYELPHRVHAIKTYPVIEPLGAAAVIYAHETGITVVWRGGKSMSERKRLNAAEIGEIVSSGRKFYDEEEEDEEEQHTSDSYTWHLDIQTFTPVLEIDVLSIPPSLNQDNPLPYVFTQSIIIAAACADNIIRIVRCALRPERTINPKDEDDVAKIAMIATDHSKASKIAVTWTAAAEEPSAEPDFEDVRAEDTLPRSPESTRSETEYELLVAFSTRNVRETNTIVNFVRLPLLFPSAQFFVFDIQPTLYPIANLAFNSSMYPSARHSQLLIAHSTGSVSIYDALISVPHERWLSSFSTSFTYPNNDIIERKHLTSAQWTSNGQSIVALLEDGVWGVWDIPSQTVASTFVLHGSIGHLTPSPNTDPVSNGAPKTPRDSRNCLVPRTPNTRKQKEDVLFAGAKEVPTPSRGGISISGMISESGTSTEDSVTFWYKNNIYNIASLHRFRNRARADAANFAVKNDRSGEIGGSLSGPALIGMEGVKLFGETITSVSQLPDRTYAVALERQLCFFDSQGDTAGLAHAPFTFQLPIREFLRSAEEAEQQLLLRTSELDLGGLDKMIDGMRDKRTIRAGSPVRKVLFDI
ncbi:hypothetical protein EJ08DRAFT_694240 [Tothia fuscella]|uniref:Nucleoporin NUP37 n=1 Tax=Tothia fuscella TaxID=1048955 RepID=A0A9P4NY39_9PEZI|nr:hypothetical protein EJ08DRAFT_694240 [Tothia fuscella]